jgi:putative ABC transport system permease protein
VDEVFNDVYQILSYMNMALAGFASKSYPEFFADRIDTPIVILLVSGLIAVLLAWGTVAGHAWKISRSSPILALRYE